MIELQGVIEVVGEPGAGKTNLLLWLLRGRRSIYVTSTAVARRLSDNYLIVQFDTFLELRKFILMDLVKIVRSKEVESVFVDGLDRFMYSECKEASSREIAQLGLQMKKCWFRWNTVFVVVNNLYENRHWCNNGDVYSPLLGYGWSYVANWKYLLKKQGGMRVLEDLEGNEVMKFKIEGFGRIRVND